MGDAEDNTVDITVRRYSDIHWISEPDRVSRMPSTRALRWRGAGVMYLNADDTLFDDSVMADVIHFICLEKELIGLLATSLIRLPDGSFSRSRRYYRPSCWSLLFRCRIAHPTVFLRKRVLLEVGGFDLRFRLAMDYDLWQRLCAAGYTPTYCRRLISIFSLAGATSVATPLLINETKQIAGRLRDSPCKKVVGAAYDAFKARQLRGMGDSD